LIDKLYLSRQRPSVAALHRTIALECFQAKIEAPSYKAVSTRVKCLDVGDVIRAREGPKASNQFRPVKGSLTAAEPLELVQIDHTLVDVIVVDDLDRKSIGRPWLSVAIDVATRAVTGFFLSLRGPSTTSAAMTINRSVLRKEAYLTGQQVEATWPIYGLPRVLHLDNAKEFRARALVRGCEQHGIQIVHRPPKTPRYGGHIERLIGTLMGEVHLLPGTTFSSVNDRGEYDSAGQAVMTMEELEKWLAWQIAGVYHLRRHSGIGRRPLEAWSQGVQRMSKPLREPVDSKRFYLDFLPFEKRSVGRSGLQLFNILYWHGALARYINDGSRHVIKYDPRDLSRVYLLERGGTYLEVPYRDLSHIAVSLREVQNCARRLRSTGERLMGEDMLFQAIEKQRALVEAAKDKTLKARRQIQELSERAKKDNEAPRQTLAAGAPETEEPVEPFPFEIWHD
jgi:putative transposase